MTLGYNWLAQHNLNINWTEIKITFRELKSLKGKLTSSGKIDIHMVSAQTMAKFCKDLGTPTFVILMANLTPLQVPTTGQTTQIVRVHLRPGTYHILVLAELQQICGTGTQGDASLLNALSRKLYIRVLQD